MTVAEREPTRSFQATIPLVEAKLHPLEPRPGDIARPRLLELLADRAAPTVTAVIAPPGYGKTTLLGQWVSGEQRPVAWLTLDDLDNDPAVLVSYLAAALDRISPIDAGVLVGASGSDDWPLTRAVPRLLSELHRWREPIVVVLDDAHRVVARPALDVLAAFLTHLPPGFRVAIAGRSEPDLPFARMRAQHDLREIGTSQLALDEDEVAELAAAAGYDLDREQIRALTERTEGWATGIYLTLLAHAHGDGASPLAGATGVDRFIAGYLRSEFERDLTGHDITLLTRTAILERMTPPLAEAIAGVPAAADRLDRLARENLLIQAVGRSRSTFRYHLLLREYLLGELERREPGAAPGLHRRAAEWYERAGDPEEAVAHLLAGGDRDAAARLVTRHAIPMFTRGQVATILRWMGAFDTADFERVPPLAVIGAWMGLMTGRPEVAERMADVADRRTFEGPTPDGAADFESQRAVLRAFMARNGPRDALTNAKLAVARDRPDSPWRSTALLALGATHALFGDLAAAEASIGEAAAASGSAATAMLALAKRASIRIRLGDWDAAEADARESRVQLDAYHYDGIVSSLAVYAVGARVAIHRGDLDRGREELVRAQLVRPLANHAVPWFSVDALLELARAYLAIADPAGAQLVLREAERIIRRRPALGTLTDELVDMRRRLAGAASTLAGSSTLTAAELRVLMLLPTYFTFQDIADRLTISRNTVKTHAMSIYGKLWASSRGEAVERAVELGLLEPYPILAMDRWADPADPSDVAEAGPRIDP